MSMNQPLPETELRARLREIAQGVLLDALVTYAAMLHEEHLVGESLGVIVVDEWSRAAHELGQRSSEILDTYRTEGGTVAGVVAALLDEGLDDHVDALIAERVQEVRVARSQEEQTGE